MQTGTPIAQNFSAAGAEEKKRVIFLRIAMKNVTLAAPGIFDFR